MLPVAQLTGTALVTEALEELRAMTAGDALDPVDGAKGLACLNRMIDTSNTAHGNIATERIDTWTLTIGKQKYTIGVDPNGVLVPDLTPADRPIRLSRCNWLFSSGNNTVRRKIDLLTKIEWSKKTVLNVAGPPIQLYNDLAYPLSTFYVYMVPDQAYKIETYSWQEFQPLASLATLMAIPPGYYEFWLGKLIIRLAAAFGVTPSASTMAWIKEALDGVQLQNARSLRARTNSDVGGGDGLYNWLSGGVEDE